MNELIIACDQCGHVERIEYGPDTPSISCSSCGDRYPEDGFDTIADAVMFVNYRMDEREREGR
jgi:ribosomal protein S27E